MLIGVISDSHDNLPKIDAAVAKLNSLNVSRVLHAGDYCSPFAALRYLNLKARMIGVFGNNDAEKEILKTKFESFGHDVGGRFSSVELEGARIALLHGDEPNLLHEIVRTQAYDLVVSGHTHSIDQKRTGRTISFNPGEICGYLSGRATIATFETSTHRIEIFDI